MSLFDVLKYPISDPPKLSELAALPTDLFNDWVKESFVALNCVSSAYLYFQSNDFDNIKARRLARLRQMIKELP